MIKFDTPPTAIHDIQEELGRDVDIIRRHIFKLEDPKETPKAKLECTLHEEMLPPAYRKEVIKMIEMGQRKQKPKYPQNTGLSYYPFQK